MDPDPDPGGPKTYGSDGFGSGSATLLQKGLGSRGDLGICRELREVKIILGQELNITSRKMSLFPAGVDQS